MAASITNVEFASLTEQLEALRDGRLSSVDLLRLYIARIERHNGPLNAIVSTDFDRALSSAKSADEVRERGEVLGPLHGLPITVKDSYETAGLRTTCGQQRLANYIPAQDAEAVVRLRRAGAIVIGKSNLPTGSQDVQTANPVFGRTNNPWNLDRSPGGSAGGGAAATAAGLTSFDFGSEIGGSTRIPAHFCGLFGHKTTWNTVPLVGHIPYAPGDLGRWTDSDLACAGFQTRNARDLEIIARAVVGPLSINDGWSYALQPTRASSLADFRVAIWTDDEACPVDSEVRSALEQTEKALRNAGASVTTSPDSLPTKLIDSHRLFEQLLYGAFSGDRSTASVKFAMMFLWRLGQWNGGEPARVLSGLTQTHGRWLARHGEHQYLRARWAQFFDKFDVVLMPVTSTPAPAHHNKDHDRWGRRIAVDDKSMSYWSQMMWNGVANLAGAPATAFPVKLSSEGLPIGLQVMGPAGGDLTTIEFADLITRELNSTGFRPPAYAA